MTDNPHQFVHFPDGSIVVTPQTGVLPDFSYQRAPDGTDLLNVLVTDPRVGPLRLVFTVSLAQWVAVHLSGMLDQLDTLRDQWDNEQDDDD